MRGAVDRDAISFGQIFLLIPPVMLITMMPISIAGWGLREATMGLAFGRLSPITIDLQAQSKGSTIAFSRHAGRAWLSRRG